VDPDDATTLSDRLAADPAWTLPAILSVFVFMLLYTPCMVTVVCIAKESNWKWALFSVGGSMVFAFVMAVVVFHTTRLFV
ncbi:MAG: ferrous iron transport protein B, partial [Desulfolutivibrio sp.]